MQCARRFLAGGWRETGLFCTMTCAGLYGVAQAQRFERKIPPAEMGEFDLMRPPTGATYQVPVGVLVADPKTFSATLATESFWGVVLPPVSPKDDIRLRLPSGTVVIVPLRERKKLTHVPPEKGHVTKIESSGV